MPGRQSGFSLLELLLVVAVAGVLAAIAVPAVGEVLRRLALLSASQTVAAEIRSARFTAVSKNTTMRVRFNCPAPGQFRVVEFVGNPAIDGAADRCSEQAYPFPDQNPAALPNADGPVRWLPQGMQFGALRDLEITNRGRVTPLTGCPACVTAAPPATIELAQGYVTQAITVSASGQVRMP